MLCAPDGFPDQENGVGTGCEFINACDSGLACLQPIAGLCPEGASGCCIPYCSLSAPDCPADLECLPYYYPDTVPEGYEDLGVCQEAM